MTTAADPALPPARATVATLRAYRADWVHFTRWCAAQAVVPIPATPEVVAAYLRSLAGSPPPPSAAAWPRLAGCTASTTWHGM
ncbi:hypothetical protein RAA17_04090 [Komagataeibacter rhaeticus]|nr:hypothetical protein [Komagataeibacter rhaeticus]